MPGQVFTTENSQACFSSKRLFFRPLTKQDKPLYFSLYTDEQVMRHIGPPYSQKQTQALFAFALKHSSSIGEQRLSWTLVQRQSQKSIGMVAFTWDLTCLDAASIGIMLHSDHQRKGYGLEAQVALINSGFTQLGLDRIYSQFASTNLACKKIYHKLGFIIDDKQIDNHLNRYFLPTKFMYLEKHKWQHSLIGSSY